MNEKRFVRFRGVVGHALPFGHSLSHHGRAATATLVATFLAIQVLVPLRHYFYPGNVNWTEEGYRMTAPKKLCALLDQD